MLRVQIGGIVKNDRWASSNGVRTVKANKLLHVYLSHWIYGDTTDTNEKNHKSEKHEHLLFGLLTVWTCAFRHVCFLSFFI